MRQQQDVSPLCHFKRHHHNDCIKRIPSGDVHVLVTYNQPQPPAPDCAWARKCNRGQEVGASAPDYLHQQRVLYYIIYTSQLCLHVYVPMYGNTELQLYKHIILYHLHNVCTGAQNCKPHTGQLHEPCNCPVQLFTSTLSSIPVMRCSEVQQ